ncbi:MAG: type 4a pilus biogenesis protein PilO [Thermoplasmata archaeon]
MKNRLLIASLILLLVNVAFFVAVVLPARRAALVHAATLESLHTRMRSLRHEQWQQQALGSLQKNMGQFRERIPPQGAILALIRRVTSQAERLGVRVPSVRYQPQEVSGEDFLKLTVQMVVDGPYRGIRRFLYEIEGLQDPLIIEKVVLTSKGEVGRITLQLQMAAYFLSEGARSTVNPSRQEKGKGVRG